MKIPNDSQGYAVSQTGTIHTRYAEHAGDARRTRTQAGARNLLGGSKGRVCQVCYPSEAPPSLNGDGPQE